jgi:polyhydroxybutyrate depolymerase
VFIADLLDLLEAELCVDTDRIFSTGMSNGGQMSTALACRLSHRIAAIAPVAGTEFLEPCDGTPVPILAFHGTEDLVLPYTGGGLNATTIADLHLWKGNVPPGMPAPLGIDESMELWAAHNGCDAEPVEERISAEVVRRSWSGCDAATVLYVVEGGGHTWPGKPVEGFEETLGHTTTDVDATQLMFELFLGEPAG